MNLKLRQFPTCLAVILLIAAIFQVAPAAPGNLVTAFDAGLGETIIARTAAIQPDGKIIVAYGGNHVKSGTPGEILRPGLARFNADGSADASFYPNPDSTVYAIAVLDTGKILIGGYFTSLQPGGPGNPTFTRPYLARLNYNGTVDETYLDTMVASAYVTCITPQPDGKVLIGGTFSTAAGQSPATRIVRLKTDGSLDPDFNCTVIGDAVQAISLDPQGNAFIGSYELYKVNTFTIDRLAKIDSHGNLYNQFDPRPYPTYAGVNQIYNIVALPDGRVLFGGDDLTNFGNLGVNSVKNAGMLSATGILDTSFNPGPNDAVYGLTPLTDGSVIICGRFTEVNPVGTANTSIVERIARILPNGSVDPNFNPAIDVNSAEVYHVLVGEDGRMKVVGQFQGVGGVTRRGIAEIENYPTSSTLTVDSQSRIEWLRSGALAEIESAIFDFSTDGGTTWTTLGAGTRIPGGWEMVGAAIPASGKVRARGRFTYGYFGSSNSIGTVADFIVLPTVSGEANLWLSGQPNGTTAEVGDSAPDQSPALADLTLIPGHDLVFRATGGTHNGPGAGTTGPDGGDAANHSPENGIAPLAAPLNSLVGVFVSDATPAQPAPSTFLDFGIAENRSLPLLEPGLRQPFFIGDGLDGDLNTQHFRVPDGATRLFLGSFDSFTNKLNTGEFTFSVAQVAATTPTILTLVNGSASANGTILAGERQEFQFLLSGETRPVAISTGGASLRGKLYDASGALVAFAYGDANLEFNETLTPGLYTLQIFREPGAGPSENFSLAIDAGVPAVAATTRPDVAVGASAGALTGTDLYSPASQFAALTSKKLKAVTGHASLANRGKLADVLKGSATGGSALFAVSYFGPEGNITAGLLAGTYTTPEMDENTAPIAIRATITPNKKSLTKKAKGKKPRILKKTHVLSLRLSSTFDPAIEDAATIGVQTK